MIKINQSNNISDPSEINLMYEFASRGKNFPEKSSFVEKMENLPGESNKVCVNADVCKLNGKSAKISLENPGNANGAKIRQTGSGKAQSSSFALKETHPPTASPMRFGNEI
jgi:hypothetical protein